MDLKIHKITYEFGLDEIKKLIAQELKVPVEKVTVNYRIQEVGGDYMDRYPGHNEVTAITVTVDKT